MNTNASITEELKSSDSWPKNAYEAIYAEILKNK